MKAMAPPLELGTPIVQSLALPLRQDSVTISFFVSYLMFPLFLLNDFRLSLTSRFIASKIIYIKDFILQKEKSRTHRIYPGI